ncbi:hypothetical protein PUMCH_001790 [Australozyma saopauloensis]|uniref:Uncharacterized protein n=1 Tax=Australozyma saopauloensis TaxID=291208 RepID=A0AAX4H8G3_9ASCO|nr:hypothetical protein PUMCH_001790 [[Candida] saopauloensis]
MTLSHWIWQALQDSSHYDHESSSSFRSTMNISAPDDLHEEKKVGVTRLIRERLNFQDDRLWKRFSARRLELIDAMDLSSKKASEQEDEIRKVADILRVEFLYGQLYYSDFDKLVRAAVQSVRRNRKRGLKTNRGNAKRQHMHSDLGQDSDGIKREASTGINTPTEPSSFLSEIAHLNTDANDSVYDMSYSTMKVITHKDESRNAIDSIIRPTLANAAKPSLPSLLKLQTNQRQAEYEQKLRITQNSLLQLIKRSKLCLMVALRPNNDHLCELGRSAFNAVTALMFETSFQNLNQTSVEYLKVKVTQRDFLAKFYRGLDQEATSNLEEETAVTTLDILIGCCIIDFGFDSVVYQVGEAMYYLILVEYPLVLKSSTQFYAKPFSHREYNNIQTPQPYNSGNSLTNLATIASEMQNFKPVSMSNAQMSKTGSSLDAPIQENAPPCITPAEERKSVTLRFLSTTFNFFYPIRSCAPPRFVELMDNAKEAFKLNENQLYGLKNTKTGSIILSDFELEKIFYKESFVDLELYSQGFQAIPIYELTSTITPSEEKSRIILPPPVKLASPPVVATSIKQPISVYRAPNQPKFQPLL